MLSTDALMMTAYDAITCKQEGGGKKLVMNDEAHHVRDGDNDEQS